MFFGPISIKNTKITNEHLLNGPNQTILKNVKVPKSAKAPIIQRKSGVFDI